jgi:hypothetical protein
MKEFTAVAVTKLNCTPEDGQFDRNMQCISIFVIRREGNTNQSCM